jgi:hypothetical protein
MGSSARGGGGGGYSIRSGGWRVQIFNVPPHFVDENNGVEVGGGGGRIIVIMVGGSGIGAESSANP